MAAYAICPHCGKSIRLESEYIESGSCPLCEGTLTTEFLRMKNAFINTEEANLSYETGKQYFDNTDFRGATEHFKKSLEYNPNHYLSFYYAGLCEIYENEKNPEYDRPLQLMRLLKYSLLKLDSAQVGMEYKIPFVRSALNEVNILLLSEFNKLSAALEENPSSRPSRVNLIMMARYINSFLMMDKELMLLFDDSTAQALLAIADLAISACIKACTSRVVTEFVVATPANEEFDAAKKIYNALMAFALSVNPKYSPEQHRPNFAQNFLFNKEALLHVQKFYEAVGKKNRAHFLSPTGEILSQLIIHCTAAVHFTYHSLFKNVYFKKNDPARVDMLVQGSAICFEILLPRFHVDGYKRTVASCKSRKKQQDITDILTLFLEELGETGRKYAAEALTDFYARLDEMMTMHYNNVMKTYSKTINKIKAQNGKEFQYYLDFLLNIVQASALALTSTVDCRLGKKKSRVSVLKIGKAAAEEFLLMNDYNIVQIETNPLHADLIRIWNQYDADIEMNLR